MPSSRSKKCNPPDVVKIVEWSVEDGCYVGSAPPLIGRCCHGADEAEVFRQLSDIVKEWAAIYDEDGLHLPAGLMGKAYSGKFQLRLGPELHQLLAVRAAQSGRSLNEIAVEAISASVLRTS